MCLLSVIVLEEGKHSEEGTEWVRKRVSLNVGWYGIIDFLGHWELRTENHISWFPYLLNDVPGIRLPRFIYLLIQIHMPVFVLPFLTQGEKHFELMGTLEAYLVCHKFCQIYTIMPHQPSYPARIYKNLLCKFIIENKCKDKCYQSFKFSLYGWTHSCTCTHIQNIHTNSLKAHFLFSVCISRKYQLRAIMKQFPFTDELFSLMGRASKWLVVGVTMAEHVEEGKESCLKFSFYAWRTAVPRGPKEGGREHMLFPQVLAAKETVSFVWHTSQRCSRLTPSLEYVSSLNCVILTMGKLKDKIAWQKVEKYPKFLWSPPCLGREEQSQ